MSPKYLYKYRKVSPGEDLTKDENIDALFNSYAILSSRKQFHDKNDSKINFNTLSRGDILHLQQECSLKMKKEVKTWFKRNSLKGRLLTSRGKEKIKELETVFNNVSKHPTNYTLPSSCLIC